MEEERVNLLNACGICGEASIGLPATGNYTRASCERPVETGSWMARTQDAGRVNPTAAPAFSTLNSERHRQLSTGCAHLVQSNDSTRFVQAPERGWTSYSGPGRP